ncbi:MAG: hypothetical protein OH319_05190 [Candidatus Parvarchaeota archaeon]|nr:hypothetical protein [Candidatus Jingweiarchaeum tengchongense]
MEEKGKMKKVYFAHGLCYYFTDAEYRFGDSESAWNFPAILENGKWRIVGAYEWKQDGPHAWTRERPDVIERVQKMVDEWQKGKRFCSLDFDPKSPEFYMALFLQKGPRSIAVALADVIFGVRGPEP